MSDGAAQDPRRSPVVDGSGRWLVIGAGSAGCVLAARLSEDPDRQVILVESGPDLVADAVPPSIGASSFFDALATPGHSYTDVRARRVTEGGAGETPYSRGRGVGGSSLVNAMVALRGDPAQYDRWGWDDVEEQWRRIALPVEVARSDELGPVDRALLAAVDGSRPALLTRHAGRRVTSAEAYLWPARARSNLTILTDTDVVRVTIEAGRAVGIVTSDGTQIAADRVVLAAGAIHSPALLQASGVDGPAVGAGLQDHPAAPFTLNLREGVPHDPNGLAVGSLWQGSGRTADAAGASLQLLPMNHLGRSDEHARLAMLMVALMNPRSEAGTVRHRDGTHPEVDFALLQDPWDRAALTSGVHLALDALATDPFREIVEDVYVDAFGTRLDALRDDETIQRWLAASCADYVHASSSCRMGSVVDDGGWVYGVSGLAVCDASIFPSIPDANTHLPTTMLAERLAARWRRDDRRHGTMGR